MSATAPAVRRFAGWCCFQVIYFVCDIFSSPSAERATNVALGNHLVNARD
jgi:hypothetical protein